MILNVVHDLETFLSVLNINLFYYAQAKTC